MEISESMEIEKHDDSMEFLSTTMEREENVSIKNSNFKKYTAITDGRFFKLVPDKCLVDTVVATCVKCEPGYVEIKGKSTSTSHNNFLAHLKRKHGDETVEEYKQYSKSIKSGRQSLSNGKKATPAKSKRSKPTTQTFKTAVLRFVISSMMPVDVILSQSFYSLMEFCKISRSDLEILNSESLFSEIEQSYRQNMEMIKSDLKGVTNVFCTANVWTGYGKRYLTITAHWISKDFSRKSAAICCQRLDANFSSHKIGSKLTEVQEEFGLQNAVVATLVDDYSCQFTKALREFKIVDHDEEDESDVTAICMKNENIFSPTVDNRWCPVQILSTYATIDIANTISSNKQLNKKHSKVMKKCNILWNHPESANILWEVIGLTLSKPNANDWTTIYTSLQEILTIKEKSDEIFQKFEMKSLQEDDFQYIEELLTCTKPLNNALGILLDSEHTLFGSLLSTLLALRRQLNKLLSQEWRYCEIILKKIVCNINEKFKDFYNFTTPASMSAAIAAFSHPEFKNRWLACVDSEHHAKLLHAFKEAVAAELPKGANKVEVETVTADGDEFFDFGTEDKVVKSGLPVEVQVFNYFSDSSQRLSMLQKYPQIKRVFLKYNTPLSSFTILDQMFGFNMWSEVMGSNRLTSAEIWILLKANMYNQ